MEDAREREARLWSGLPFLLFYSRKKRSYGSTA